MVDSRFLQKDITDLNEFIDPEAVYSENINTDGLIDIIGTSAVYDDILWWKQVQDADGTITWEQNDIDLNFESPVDVYTADVDGDNYNDVIAVSNSSTGTLSWWKNNNGNGTSWTQYDIATTSRTTDVHADDINGDGYIDVLTTSGYDQYKTSWWKQKRDSNNNISWEEFNLIQNVDPISVDSADLDGDGDLDILAALFNSSDSEEDLVWWQNNGTDTNWTLYSITSEFYRIKGIESADIDGDKDIDIVGTSAVTDTIVWWENTNGDGTVWTQREITSTYDSPVAVHVDDVDGDGDFDILSGDGNSDGLAWWENINGDGSVWTQNDLSDNFGDTRDIYSADVDGDGDIDIIGASDSRNFVWWENKITKVQLQLTTQPQELANGSFNIILTNSTSSVTAEFTVSGRAEISNDYVLKYNDQELIPNNGVYSVILASDGTYPITIETLEDGINEGNESLTITLRESNSYVANTTAPSIETTILDKPTTTSISNFTPVIYETAVDFGNTVSLDGVDDYVSIPNSDNINFGTDEDFTVEAWIKADSNQADLGNGDNDIIEKWSGGGVGYPFVIRYVRSTGKISVARYDGSTSAAISSNSTINDNEFHHVAFVKNGDTLSLYIDGHPEGTANDTTNNSTQNTSPLYIGNRANRNHFKGEVDEVRIWNVARTQDEIQDNLYQKLGGTENGLVAYYNFDEDSVDGNTISDITENANNGTLTNGDETNFVDSEIPTFQGYVDIELNNEVTNQPGIILNYQIESDSTATQDEDFYNSQTDVSTTDGEPQTDSIFIAEGEDSARIYLTALPDAVVEGDENIKLTLLPDFNKALTLDGIDDYVSISDSDSIDFGTDEDFTVETWVKADSNQADLQYSDNSIIEKWSGSGGYPFVIRYLNSSGKIRAARYDGSNAPTIDSTTTINDGQFHHIAFVKNGETLSLYIDGNPQGTTTDTTTASTQNTSPLHIGNRVNQNHFKGEIDEVRIWNTARTEAEIQDTIYATLNGDETNLVGYYNFNDDSVEGNTISDVTTNSNDGTLQDNSNLAYLTNSVAYDPFATNGATYGIQSTQSAEITIQDTDNYVVDIVIANKFAEDLSDAANYVVVDENGDATFQVKLTSQPTQDVTVSISIDGTNNELTFTPNDWDTYQSVTTSSISDGSNITLTNTVGNYSNQTKQLSVSAKSNDEVTILELTEGGAELELTPTVSISATNPEATEGNETESGVFTVSLDTPAPEGGLVIPFSVSSTATEGTDYNLYADSFTYSGESALSFDGVDDYVSIPDSDNIDFGTDKDFTVETWVKADSNQADLQYSDNSIIEKWSGSGSYPFVIRYLNSSGKIRAARYDGSNAPTINSSTTINDGQFHHIAFVKNGETLSLYIDGNLEDSTTDTTTASTQNTSPLHIGKRGNNRNYFKGEVDEVRIWETARTEEEIQQNLYSKLEGTEDGLAAYYNFDELNENISDVTGNGNDGTSYIGQSLSLDGSDDYASIPDSDNIDFGTDEDFTVEAWIKADFNQADLGNGDNDIIEKWSGGGVGYPFVIRYLNASGKIIASRYDGSTTRNNPNITSNTTINDNEFHHVAFIKEGETLSLYIDGNLEGTTTDTTTNSTQNTSPLHIGNRANRNHFKGEVDELRIWNKARTQTEIQENLYNKLEGTEENLVAYYNFENDSGTTITDSTGNNDGTLNNGDGNNLVASTIGYPLTDWETTKTPVVKIAEGETEATITVSKIDNEIAEAADEDVTVTLEYGKNYDLNTSKQSAFITLKDDDTAGIEFAKLDTVGSVDNIAQEFIVSTAYDATTGQLGLTLNNGNNSYTFAAGTELTFDGGAVVTVDSQTTIAATGETLLNVTFASDSPTQEITADEISEIELVNIELSSFATTDTDAIAIFNVSLAQAPTEDVTVTLTDANGTATGTVNFTTSNWDTSQSVRMTVEEGTSESAFNLGVSTTTATQGDINYGVTPEGFSFANRTFDIPISTETVATSLEFYNNTVVTSEVATIELEVTSDYANGNVGLKLASGADSYTLTAGTQLSFTDGAVVTVDTDTTISTDDAGTPVSVSFVNAIAAQETISFTDEQSGTAIEVQVNTAYNATTGEVGLQISSGVNELTFSNGTELTFSSGAVVTVTQDTTLSSLTETSVPVSFSNQIITDETTEIELPGEDSTNFAVRLSSQPTDAVTLDLTIGDTTEGEFANSSSTETLNFTTENWDTYQEVTLYGVDDTEDDGNLEYSITSTATSNDLNYNGTTNSISVSNQDNESTEDSNNNVSGSNIATNTASINVINSQLSEDGSTTAQFEINLSEAAPEGGMYVKYEISSDTATTGEDFYALIQGDEDENPLSVVSNFSSGHIPVFTDIDNDGDYDLFLGKPAEFDTGIEYYENTGDSISPFFEERVGNDNPLNHVTEGGTLPSFVDLYDRGLDAFVGYYTPVTDTITSSDGTTFEQIMHYESNIAYYQNVPAPRYFDEINNPGNPLATYSNTLDFTDIDFADIDNDKDFDLFVSNRGGFILYFENIGDSDSPNFSLRTGSDNPFDEINLFDFLGISLVDFDSDGDLDAFIGETTNRDIRYYVNSGTPEDPVFTQAANSTNTLNIDFDSGHPSVIDIDNDGYFEIFVSGFFHRIDFYEHSSSGVVYIPGGETTASAEVAFIALDDQIDEDKENFDIRIVDNIDDAFNITVTSNYNSNVTSLGLQINDTEVAQTYFLTAGTVLNFTDSANNIYSVTISEDTAISNTSTEVVIEQNSSLQGIDLVGATTSVINSDYVINEQGSTATFEIVDNDIAGVTIVDSNDNPITSLTTSEDGSTETFYVSLNSKPSDENKVTVYLGVDNSEEGLLSDDNQSNENLVKLVFSPSNWDTSQAVTLTSLGDDIDDGDINYNIITTVISDDIKYNEDNVILKIAEDFNYVANSTNTISLLVDELNILETEITAGTQLNFGNGMVLEVDSDTTLNNSTATSVNVNQVQAANQILANTTALIDEDNSNSTDYTQLIVTENYADGTLELRIDESSSVASVALTAGQQLTFSNGTVFTVDSAVTLSNTEATAVSGTIDNNLLKVATTEVSTGSTAEVTTDYTDGDSGKTEITVTTNYDEAAGTVGLQINDSTASTVELVAGTQINFSNGAAVTLDNDVTLTTTASSVNVSGVGNAITTSFTETISPDISVTNTDNDDAGVTVDKYDISSLEGYGNNFFNVKLDTKPVGEVTVTMNPVDASGDKDYNISLDDEFDGESYSVTFDETDWNLAKAVKVTAVDDYDVEYNHTSYIDFAVSSTEDSSYNAVTPPDNIIVKIEDNDLPNAGIQAVAAATEAGSPGYFVVTLDNPAPAGFDGTGIVVDYTVSGTVDVDGSGETDDLKPFTGSVRIAPGESRSPIIAFPIDDFKAESIPLEVTNVSGNTVTLEIDTTKLSEIQKESLIEVGTVTIDVGTELTFTNGAIANVIDSNNNNNYQLTISADGGVTSEDVEIEFTSDITTIENGDTTSIPKEAVVVTLSSGSDYSINENEPPSATLSIQDNDKPGIRIVEIGDTTVVNENGTAEFYISLLSQPEADVTVSLNGISTTRDIVVDQAYSSGATTIQLKVDDSEVNSLFLAQGTTLGNITVSQDTTIFSDKFTDVGVSLSGNISAGESFTYSYTELGFDNSYTFNSDNWYKLQTVTVKGIDDAVAETGDFHTSTVEYTIESKDSNGNTADSNYDGFEVAPQTINIIDRTFDAENTTESLIEGFFALQDGLDSVSLPIIGNLDGVAPSFIEDFIGDLVDEIKQTEYITAESLQNTFNNVLSGRFGIVNVEITDLSYNNIEFFVDIEDSFTESISINGDLGLPALGIGIESDGSLDASFDYGIDLAFGINTDDGFYINTEDTGFEVAASFGFSEDFSATGKLGFLQLDVANGNQVGGTGIDAEFVISLEDADTSDDANSDEEAQLTLSELNSLRKSDKLFDSIKYGFSGDAALDLDITTSIEGNTGFPSFGFNLSSELPLFNYSNSDDDEEVSGATLIVSASETSTEGSSITLDVTSDATELVQINKGTELTFGDSSVVLTKTAYILSGTTPTKIYGTVADDGDNNQTESVTIADEDEAKLVSGDFSISFNDITLDLGGFVTDLMSPIISYVNELIEPFEPIIDVLQTEIELLDTLDLVDMFDENGDGSATLIEVASTLATTFGGGNLKYQKFFDAVTGIIDLVDTINDLEETISSGENLGVDFGDYELQNFAAAGDEDVSEVDTTTAGTNKLNSNVKNSAKNKGGSVKTKVKNFFSKLDDLGIGIPLLEDPLTAINLFLGKDVDLVTYDIPELDIEFSIEQSFPIFGSIKGLLEGGFSLYSDLVVGFDTYGLSQWKELDFALEDSYLISDGFYLSDVDPDTGEDVDELTLDATIAAGVSASAVVAKAEVKGGITGTAALDIIDVGEFTGTSDGKLRGSEVLEADSLLDLFSLSGSLDAFVKALVKVGIDVGFFEIMKTVWSEEFSVTLFEFELGNSPGTLSQSYIEGATVFFDSNLNGILEEGEPVTTSNADGSYNLKVPLLFFDTNDNGKIDPEEGRIVTEGGTDSSSGVAYETPFMAPYGSRMVTPLTTLKQKLIEDGSTSEEAEELIKEALDLPEDIKLEQFDSLAAMSKGDERGTKVYKAHVQMQSLFTQTSEYIKGFGKDELIDEKRPIPEQAIEAIAKGIGKRKGKPPINFSDSTELEELIKEPLEGKFKPNPGKRPQRLPESFGILAQTVASGNREIDEVFKGVPPQDILGKVAPVKQITQDKLPKQLRKLAGGGATREDVTSLLERVPDAEQFLLKEQSQPGEPPRENDDTIILPKKPTKLARGERRRNLLELDGDDLTDTKIKFSLSSKNLPEGRIHEIAIFTTEDEEGTINGINPEDANYKQAALNKARSIFSILPDDFIANPKRIMKGFADQNIGFLLIKNGTVDSARRGRTSLDNVLVGTEKQGDSFRGIQISEKSENSFRLSFEDEMGDADFTDIVIDAELTDETPEIGTNIQGESEGEMLDLRDYADKQIEIKAPIVREESEYENVVGFYVVEDVNGAVSDPLTGNLINPGEEGYIKAALRNSQNNAFQMGEQGIGGSKEIKGGQIFAPFAIANGTLEEVLDDNPDNDPQVYFAHIGANTDGVDHIRNLGGNTWGVEDMLGGGDMDFNDIVFKLDVTVR